MKCGVQIVENNFNDIFLGALYKIDHIGSWETARGLSFKEIISPQLILTDPKNCLITLKARKLNYAYLIIEKLMYLSGVSYPEVIMAYNGNMKSYLNLETRDFDGAYGPRIRENNQFMWCYKQLKADPQTRQAVITIHDSRDCRKTKDNCCTLSLQFFLRDNGLNLVANMRSNDLLWGTCLDVPAFCFLQEVMAHLLGVPVGAYIHQPGSLHFYDEFKKRLFEIIEASFERNDEVIPEWKIGVEELNAALEAFWVAEARVRKTLEAQVTGFETIDAYLTRLLNYWQKKSENT